MNKIKLKTEDFILIEVSPTETGQLNLVSHTLARSKGLLNSLQTRTIKSESKRHSWIWTIKQPQHNSYVNYFVKTLHTDHVNSIHRHYIWHKLKQQTKWRTLLTQHDFYLPPTLFLMRRINAPKDAWQIDAYLEGFSNLKVINKLGHLTSDHMIDLLSRFVDQVSKLHQFGFIHGDLKWSNLLWHAQEDQIIIVDWDKLKKSDSLKGHANDMARLLVGFLEDNYDLETINNLKKQYLNNFQHSKSKINKLDYYIDNRISKLRKRKNI